MGGASQEATTEEFSLPVVLRASMSGLQRAPDASPPRLASPTSVRRNRLKHFFGAQHRTLIIKSLELLPWASLK